MVSHRGIMTIYFKSQSIRVRHVPQTLEKPKLPNYCFCFYGVRKYVTNWVICVDLYLVYVYHHNGITQSPHDHLFQKSKHHGATCAAKA